MSKKILVLVLTLIGVILFSVGGFYQHSNKPKFEINGEKIPVHKVKFYEEILFFEGVEKAGKIGKPEYLIKGGIVPHHLFASEIIAGFFKSLSFQNPETIILIGPNHYERGNFKALGSLNNWETPFGVVEADAEIIKKLLDNNLIQIDESVLVEEHSVSGMLPFIKYYMPQTKVVPVLLKWDLSEKESEILAENLKELVSGNIIVVAAVDFSHYLTSPKAKEKDEVTLTTMKDFDYRKLYSLNNEYLDSPSSIGVLLKLMQKINSANMELLSNTNSGEMQKNNSIETTSYFSILYH